MPGSITIVRNPGAGAGGAQYDETVALAAEGALDLRPDFAFEDEFNPDSAAYAGYTKLFGKRFADYTDTSDLLANVPFSTDSQAPVASMVTLKKDDPVFEACAEMVSPYNNDWAAGTGSAGKQPHLHDTFSVLQDRVIWRFVRRFGGTQHPVHPSGANYAVGGTYPGGGTDVKVAFILWESGSAYNGGRVELLNPGSNEQIGVGFGTGANHPVATETLLLEPGVTDGWPSSTKNVSAQFTGLDWYEYSFDAWRVSDDLFVMRFYRQKLTVSGAYDPQPIEFHGWRYDRTSGAVFPKMRVAQYYINKNQTTVSDALTTTRFDTGGVGSPDPGIFASDSTTHGTLRAEGAKPFDGVRHYLAVKMGFTGGDYRPFTDHGVQWNIEDIGRGDADWPGGI